MSIEAIAYVLNLPADRARNGARLVAIAIANFANEEGEAWPSIGTIARLAALNEQTAKRAIVELANEGVIERIVGAAPDDRIPSNKRPNLYRFTGFPQPKQGGTNRTPQTSQGGTNRPLGGYKSSSQGGTNRTPKPLLNRQEPSGQSPNRTKRTNEAGVTDVDVLESLAARGVVPDFGDEVTDEAATSLAEVRAKLESGNE